MKIIGLSYLIVPPPIFFFVPSHLHPKLYTAVNSHSGVIIAENKS